MYNVHLVKKENPQCLPKSVCLGCRTRYRMKSTWRSTLQRLAFWQDCTHTHALGHPELLSDLHTEMIPTLSHHSTPAWFSFSPHIWQDNALNQFIFQWNTHTFFIPSLVRTGAMNLFWNFPKGKSGRKSEIKHQFAAGWPHSKCDSISIEIKNKTAENRKKTISRSSRGETGNGGNKCRKRRLTGK